MDHELGQSAPPPRWQDVVTLLIAVAMLAAPAFTGQDAYLRGALISRVLAFMLVLVSLWILSGRRNFLPEVASCALGTAFVVAAFSTHCVELHRIVSLAAGSAVFALSAWAACLSVPEESDGGNVEPYRERAR